MTKGGNLPNPSVAKGIPLSFAYNLPPILNSVPWNSIWAEPAKKSCNPDRNPRKTLVGLARAQIPPCVFECFAGGANIYSKLLVLITTDRQEGVFRSTSNESGWQIYSLEEFLTLICFETRKLAEYLTFHWGFL